MQAPAFEEQSAATAPTTSLSVFVFARLKPDAGAAVSGRMVSTSEERATAAAE
jgi:hypothetical protein